MSDFISFVKQGRIGQLYRGMSKAECQRVLGLPVAWIGKPPCFGPVIVRPEESHIWFFYGGSVGISFDSEDFSKSIHLLPDRMDQAPDIFEKWPISPKTTMGDLRTTCVDLAVVFEEGVPETEHYWIIMEGKTCAFSLSAKKGQMLQGAVSMIEHCSSVEEARDAVGLFPPKARPLRTP